MPRKLIASLSRQQLIADRTEIFWSRVDFGPDCWEWTGCLLKDLGYGQFRLGKTHIGAHRFSWILAHGEIPDGIFVLHKCDNRKCVRPDHLFIGTQADNIADMIAKGRKAMGDTVGPDRRPRGERHGTHTMPHSVARGERNGRAKLTNELVLQIRSLRRLGRSLQSIADEFKVSKGAVWDITRRARWRHVKDE